MLTVQASPQTLLCAHCGKSNPPNSHSGFCCAGCEAVHRLLHESGLEKFYELRESGYCFKPASPAREPESMAFQDWEPARGENQIKIFVEGIHCTACLWILEKLPQLLPNAVKASRLDVQSSMLTVQLVPGADPALVGRQILRFGYTPHLVRDEDHARALTADADRRTLIEVAVAGALAGNVMLMSIPLYSGVQGRFESYFEWISFGLAIPSLFYCGRSFFKNVWYGVRSGQFPIDAPILLALVIAFSYSAFSLVTGGHSLYFDSLTALVFLLLSSRYYLAKLRQSSNLSLGVLEFFQPAFTGRFGDRVQLTASTVLAFDGHLLRGELWVDSSRFSGETEPVRVRAGDRVLAGTTITSATPDACAEVLQVGGETRLATLLARVKESRLRRSRTEILSDRLGRGLLTVVTAIGLAALVWFFRHGQASTGIERVLALLIVTCPCALALATPLTFSLAMKSLLNQHVLVKDPEVLDRAATVERIYFDKTGTLTLGQLTVADDLTRLAPATRDILYSLCEASSHPVSRALFRALTALSPVTRLVEWDELQEKPGVGIFARRGEEFFSLRRSSDCVSDLGSVSLYRRRGEGGTEAELCAIHVRDELRADSPDLIRELRRRGYRPVILSGDQSRAVAAVAEAVGTVEAYSALSPEKKAELARDGIMVGDGLNDTLSLVSSRIGIAVQGGMEAAIASSQVISLKPGISAVLDLLSTSARVRRCVQQNFLLSTTYNVIGGALALSGHMNPLIAAILMPMSAATVFTATLLRFRRHP